MRLLSMIGPVNAQDSGLQLPRGIFKAPRVRSGYIVLVSTLWNMGVACNTYVYQVATGLEHCRLKRGDEHRRKWPARGTG
jgi:hypothetical protein